MRWNLIQRKRSMVYHILFWNGYALTVCNLNTVYLSTLRFNERNRITLKQVFSTLPSLNFSNQFSSSLCQLEVGVDCLQVMEWAKYQQRHYIITGINSSHLWGEGCFGGVGEGWIWSCGNVNILLTTMNLGRPNEQFKIKRCCGSFAYDVHLVVGYGKRKRKNNTFKLHLNKFKSYTMVSVFIQRKNS